MRFLFISLSVIVATSVAADCFADSATLRVGTFNINWGNADLPSIERAIRAADCDIVCLQETNSASERFLKARLADVLPHAHFKGHEGRFRAERFGFLSRLKITGTRFLPPRGGLFGTCFATVVFEGIGVRIANVHLQPFVVRRRAGLSDVLQALSVTEETHAREITEIVRELDVSAPTIVCGDFNSPASFRAPQRLGELGFVDSFAAVTEQPDQTSTWSWMIGRVPLRLRIDFVFHSRHFATVGSRVIAAKGSDHSLVVSELALGKAANETARK